MSQVDEQLDEQTNATDASSDNSGVAAFAVGDTTPRDDLDLPDDVDTSSASSVPQEGDSDYEPDEPAEPQKEVAVGNVERARAKVQLDIEDAPFLEDDEEEEEEAAGGDGKSDPDAKDGEGEESEEDAKKKKKKKLLIFGGIGLLVLIIIIAIVAFLFLGGGEDETVEEEPVPEVLRDEDGNVIPNPELEPFVVIVEPFVEPTGPPIYSLDLEPFWVEVRDEAGNTFFVVCNFTLVVEDEKGLSSIQFLVPSIRDAIYYHLATQDFNLLTNNQNLPAIRSSLITRVNELLSGIKLSDLLYTNYTVR